jgi:o-succinylbenzoate synthase
MKITDIQTGRIRVPLKKPFKTALRSIDAIENVIVRVVADTGQVGYGEAAYTPVITGDTIGSILWAVEEVVAKTIIGMEIENIEAIMERLDKCMVKNGSAKAAVDIAVYDLYGQLYQAPLAKLWGGYRDQLTTDITISVNDPEQMAGDSREAVKLGYDTLKIKLGKDPSLDLQRMKAIRAAVGPQVKLRADANQGWQPKEAVRILSRMEGEGIGLELVEQPVAAHDLEGLKYVTDRVLTPVMADESVFSPWDAMRILQMRAADIINIKLMKTGGIHNALKICGMAEACGMECMIGCMMETAISVSAAAHLAAAKRIITRVDLDGPALCRENPVAGGALFDESKIRLSNRPGLGFGEIHNVEWQIRSFF